MKNSRKYLEGEYVKGWVDLNEAISTLSKEFGEDKEVMKLTHTYAFWGVGSDECGEPRQLFYPRNAPGRGRFKITEVLVKEAA